MKRRSIYSACQFVGGITFYVNLWIHEHPSYLPWKSRPVFLLAVIGVVAYAIAFGISLENNTYGDFTQLHKIAFFLLFIAFSVIVDMIL